MQDELVRLGESMVSSSEGTRALALELCREFEDKFLQHIMTGEVITHKQRLVVYVYWIIQYMPMIMFYLYMIYCAFDFW